MPNLMGTHATLGVLRDRQEAVDLDIYTSLVNHSR
jgi:hypothetical protein